MRKVICLFILAAMISGCAIVYNASFINYSKTVYSPQRPDYSVDLYFQDKPQKQYDVIGEIIGTVDRGEQVRPMLESKIREVGGDGVIDIETTQGIVTRSRIRGESVTDSNGNIVGEIPVARTATENIINVKAKVIKYKQ